MDNRTKLWGFIAAYVKEHKAFPDRRAMTQQFDWTYAQLREHLKYLTREGYIRPSADGRSFVVLRTG